MNPGFERIAGILCGDEATIDACGDLCGQWYRLLLAKCYFSCPTIDPRTIIHSSASPSTIEHTILADLINRIFELEKVQRVRQLQVYYYEQFRVYICFLCQLLLSICGVIKLCIECC